jgi:hypothetical protein
MKLAAFDLEIASILPNAEDDWSRMRGLGISCAAVALEDEGAVQVWQGRPRFTSQQSVELVRRLMALHDQGWLLVTWNGCGFDFRVLAEESGMAQECGLLALNHVDLMLMITFNKGWYLSLEAALQGAGLAGKLKAVRLSDGTEIRDMDGSKAPELWAAGEYEAVLAYLQEDVLQLLELAQVARRRGKIQWTSRRGNPQEVRFTRLLTVEECFDLPEPDTSWMSDPPTREQFVSWIPM